MGVWIPQAGQARAIALEPADTSGRDDLSDLHLLLGSNLENALAGWLIAQRQLATENRDPMVQHAGEQRQIGHGRSGRQPIQVDLHEIRIGRDDGDELNPAAGRRYRKDRRAGLEPAEVKKGPRPLVVREMAREDVDRAAQGEPQRSPMQGSPIQGPACSKWHTDTSGATGAEPRVRARRRLAHS